MFILFRFYFISENTSRFFYYPNLLIPFFLPLFVIFFNLTLFIIISSSHLISPVGKDNTGVTDRVVNQLLTLIDGADETMGGVVEDSDEDEEGGVGGGDGGSSNQVSVCACVLC